MRSDEWDVFMVYAATDAAADADAAARPAGSDEDASRSGRTPAVAAELGRAAGTCV